MNLTISCVLTSHRKKQYIHDAIESILRQSSPNWQLIITDSGELYDLGEFDRYKDNGDPRIFITTTGYISSNEHNKVIATQGWAINECFRRNLVTGDLAVYLSDDDCFTPNAFGVYLERAYNYPEEHAWYGLADRYEILQDGTEVSLGELPPSSLGIAGLGTDVNLDSKIDGGQFCHRIKTAYAPWPESSKREIACHCDGIWMDAVGKLVTIYPIPVKVLRHRHTPISTYTKSSDVK